MERFGTSVSNPDYFSRVSWVLDHTIRVHGSDPAIGTFLKPWYRERIATNSHAYERTLHPLEEDIGSIRERVKEG